MTEATKPPTALEMLRAKQQAIRSGIDDFVPGASTPESEWFDRVVAAFEREQAARDERDTKLRAHLKRAQRPEGTRNDVLCALALLDGGRADDR